MKKEFETVSSEQIIEFSKIFNSFLDEVSEEFDNKKDNSKNLPSTLVWHTFYELDFIQVTGYIFHCMNLEDQVSAANESGEPLQHFLDLLSSGFVPDISIKEFDPQKLTNFCAAVTCNMMNMVCFAAYRTNINQLLKEAGTGSDVSLLKAINIDASVVSTNIAAKRISNAVADDDGAFFEQLSKAVKGSYPKDKPSEKFSDMNFFMHMIESTPGHHMDYEALHKLFTEDLKIYPDVTQSKDSFGSMKKQLDRTRHRVKDIKS